MPDFILPSKLVPERITVRFNLASELLPRETIVSATVDVTVSTGVDPNPSAMLVGEASWTGQEVKQQVQCGLPGVVYLLTCSVVGSFGRAYQNRSVLAVLTDYGRTPPLNTYVFTSRPYPLSVLEKMHATMENIYGRVQPQPFPTDYMQISMGYLTGTLFGSYQAYTYYPPEAYTAAMEFQHGELYGHAIAYTIPHEDMQATMVYQSGTLVGEYVSYDRDMDEMQASMSFVSGTLV